MKIVFYSVTPLRHTKEATTITILQLATELRSRGHEVVIIAPEAERQQTYPILKGVPIFRFKYSGSFFGKMFAYPFLLSKIQRERGVLFEVIHSFSANSLFAGPALISKLVAPRAGLIHTLKSYPRKEFFLYHLLLNLTDIITVPTQTYKSKIRLVRESRIKVVHSSIDSTKFKPLNKQKLREKYNCKMMLFYYGSMHEHKGITVLIQALPLIKKEVPALKVVFAPRYKEITKEKEMIKEFGAEGFTEFITNDIPILDYLNLAEVVVLPYTSLIATEGNPSCLLESMACKTPVVTTELLELQEIVTKDQDVLMAVPGDYISLANQVIRLLKDRRLRQRLAENAYQKVSDFDIKKIADEFLNLYHQVHKKGGSS